MSTSAGEIDRRSALNDARVRNFVAAARVAHLATADTSGQPHNVPLCFWYDGGELLYFVIDEKPKREHGRAIKRMRNLAENPRAAIVVDHYEENWSALAYVMIQGAAAIVEDAAEYQRVITNLRAKYPQYRAMALAPERNPLVRVTARRVHAWGNFAELPGRS
ncbi:MAG TPA: TIGR03668 family PPOX class F420-dependent oxidoreductase [Candidatus Binataceae bacterium]|jgi:PPOX class probable F420-dependent enzyme|nr:TIGR03668 family PPOX class F420-dependent oxidoreductase [Candidatus Binataceae bacterium]